MPVAKTKRDYYDVLSVKRDSTPEEIKKSFRELAKKHHPDRNPDNKIESEEKFKEVAEAYAVLSDEEKRRRYDQLGHDGMQGGHGPGDFSGVSVDDLFASFFGGRGSSIFEEMFGGSAGGRNAGREQGASLRFEIEITLDEAHKGVTKTVDLVRDELCGTCKGSGAKVGTKPTQCTYCRGQGYVLRSQGFFAMRSACTHCHARGEINESPCAECRGGGRVRKRVRLEVPIPSGIENGTRIRLAGEGDPGEQGGARGDLYIFVKVKEHEYFMRRARDLLIEMPVTYPMAALGGEIEVPTLDARMRLSIPKGTQSGQLLRLRGMGMPDVNRYGKGDLFVRVVIETPTKLTSEQETLLRKLAEIEKVQVKPHSQRTFFDKLKDFFGEE